MAQSTNSSVAVDFQEVDLTSIIGTAGASGGAFAGNFVWGPAGEIVTLSDPRELEDQLGKPNNVNYADWFSAFNFLSYTGNLKVVRAIDEDAINACNGGVSGLLIKNKQHFDIVKDSSTPVKFAARYPGALGNSISVHIADASTFSGWYYANEFEAAPGTSEFAASVGAENDEMHIIVIDRLGKFTGVAGAVLKRYPFVSKASNSKDINNAPNYYMNVINRDSAHIWAVKVMTGLADHTYADGVTGTVIGASGGAGYTEAPTVTFGAPPSGGRRATGEAVLVSGSVDSITITDPGHGYISAPAVTLAGGGFTTAATATSTIGSVTPTGAAWGTELVQDGVGVIFKDLAAPFNAPLANGADSTTVGAQELITALELFQNQEEVDVSLIFSGPAGGEDNHTVVNQWIIDNLAEQRKDLVAFLSPKQSDVMNKTQGDAVSAIIATRNLIGRSTSFAVMDSGWKFQYDVYNDVYRWVPLNADIAGLCALVDNTTDPWVSPGGYTRGRLRNVVSLAFNPNKTSRDAIYKVGINPVVTFNTDGTVLYGDKTLLGKNSAFTQIGVRRLFILLRKTISAAAKAFLFETNNSFAQAAFVTLVSPFLQEIKGRGGMDDFKVRCDVSNNGPQVVMARQFVGDVFVKPNYSINYVKLNAIAVRQDVAFEEFVGINF
jgi:hypothetical protein